MTEHRSQPEPPILLAGPTAVGKSEVALCLAERIGGEIISVDSMQVYRGMDIGTAKPTEAERARVPHHLLDVVSVSESFDASRFEKMARAAVSEIQARGRVPIFCGGTGLYFNAFVHGVGNAPATDPALRAELQQLSLEQLLEELRRDDPATFERIDRNNPRRVLRAVAVLRLSGRSASEHRVSWQGAATPDPRHFGLEREPDDLRKRIDARVEEMFRLGLVEETKRLLVAGLAANPTAMQALGYRQVVEHLKGERGLTETIQVVKSRTRQYAKRQMTWFRGKMSLNWIHFRAEDPAETIVARIAEAADAAE